MKPNDKAILTAIDMPASELVFWTFRYFLGRRTAAANYFAQCLVGTYPLLDKREQDQIRLELDAAFAKDDVQRANKDQYYWLGDDIDRQAWELVRDVYAAKKGGVK